ncbi:mitochondrial protein cyt-4 [Colletotrichum musicola]|uniref:Mitochondrial protein cyt-4 n=1 Tax=Colletotrichum musicola TaxID=2175873 RepID=A0A8H6KU58_9PEZI|nr:mitochondrial protein cyt-4 [Colletotrichum musicola]
MLKSAGRPYVCWRCLTTGTSVSSAGGGSRHALGAQVSSRSYTNFQKHYPGGRGGRGGDGEYRRRGQNLGLSREELAALREKSNIRERLRSWESENHIPARRLFEDLPAQEVPLSNHLTRPDMLPGATDAMFNADDPEGTRSAKNRALFDGDELMDLRGATSALVAGDLIETRYGAGRTPILGICLGRHYGHQYFYTSTGEVVAETSLRTLFTIPNFVKTSKFRRLLDIIPEEPVRNPRNVLVHRTNPGALEDVAELQVEINKFYASAAEFYHEQPHLDWAINQVAHANKVTFWGLEQIANRLLPHRCKDPEGKFPPHVLYAVHTALQRDDWGFRPVSMRFHRRNYIYEVRPSSDIEVIRKVESQVRELVEASAQRDEPPTSEALLRRNSLGIFILRSRAVIEKHRKRRPWTPHGMIGPSDEPVNPEDVPAWPEEDKEYIRFMELWACHRIVTKASQLETLGATILRLTDKYNDADWLAHWTGFSFLQEIGWIPPYEIPARYQYRLMNAVVERGQPMVMPRMAPWADMDVKNAERPDIAEGHRRDWGDATVFCVDAESTDDVDDGFSVEQAEKPGEYWIHVHIADPAAFIDPHTRFARHLEMAPSSLYLAGFPQKMLPESLEKRFSLDPDRPVLTFSAKVNEQGVMLDHKVEPGVVHRVIHVPKSEVAAILPGLVGGPKTDAPSFAPFSVGKEPPPPPEPTKTITRAGGLPAKDRDDLLLLNRLCKALKHRRQAKGQLPPFQARFANPEVSLASVVPVVPLTGDPETNLRESTDDPEGSTKEGSKSSTESGMAWRGDPYIRFAPSTQTEADRLVERLMHTCGEVAAAFCAERGIAVPYTYQPEALRNAAELRDFRRKHIDPLASQNRPVPVELLHSLFALVGTSELTVRPMPFYSVGLDAYAKASSPLRRFGDMLVHWQIHAALAEERRLGESLAGKDLSSESFMPWTRDALAPKLPMLQNLQRQVRDVDNRDGPVQWMAQALLRAWRFKEAPLPEKFTFVVDGLYPFGLRGRLSSFYDLPAAVDSIRLGEICKVADVHVDDLFEVEIADVNVVTGRISLQPLRKMKKTAAAAAASPAGKVASARG